MYLYVGTYDIFSNFDRMLFDTQSIFLSVNGTCPTLLSLTQTFLYTQKFLAVDIKHDYETVCNNQYLITGYSLYRNNPTLSLSHLLNNTMVGSTHLPNNYLTIPVTLNTCLDNKNNDITDAYGILYSNGTVLSTKICIWTFHCTVCTLIFQYFWIHQSMKIISLNDTFINMYGNDTLAKYKGKLLSQPPPSIRAYGPIQIQVSYDIESTISTILDNPVSQGFTLIYNMNDSCTNHDDCGGILHGICLPNGLCKCHPGWIGHDCQYGIRASIPIYLHLICFHIPSICGGVIMYTQWYLTPDTYI